MVTNKKTIETPTKRSRVKLSKLKLNKETVRDLTSDDQKHIKGGKMAPSGEPLTCDFPCKPR